MIQRFPAFFLGVSALTGMSVALFPEGKVAAMLWLSVVVVLRRWMCAVGWLLFAAYGFYATEQAQHDEGAVAGTFSIHQFRRHQSPFYQDLLYQGELKVGNQRLPCSMYRKAKERISANCDYEVEGTLKKRGPYHFVLKPKKLEPVENSWSLAEFRFQAKDKLHQFLKDHLSTRASSNLLFALLSGEVEERSLRYHFSKLGLQHILAISGFHFGLLISFLSSALGMFLQRHWRWAAILIGMTLYFLFIGSAPAVERAWISGSLFFVMKWFKKDVEPLNLLGAALILELCLHPFSPTNLGFQLSYLSCFGILVFFKPLQALLQHVFPERRYVEVAPRPFWDQCLFLASAFFRNGIALSLAVNVVILPLLLLYFGSFPPLSLIYNLFYPHLIGALLCLFFMIAAIHGIIPGITFPLFWFLDWFAKTLFNLAAFPPVCLDRPLFLGQIPPWSIPFYLLGLLGITYLTDRHSLSKIEAFHGGRSSVG